MQQMPDHTPPRSNGKTALVLFSVVLVFFLGVIAKRVLFG